MTINHGNKRASLLTDETDKNGKSLKLKKHLRIFTLLARVSHPFTFEVTLPLSNPSWTKVESIR